MTDTNNTKIIELEVGETFDQIHMRPHTDKGSQRSVAKISIPIDSIAEASTGAMWVYLTTPVMVVHLRVVDCSRPHEELVAAATKAHAELVMRLWGDQGTEGSEPIKDDGKGP